MADGRRSGPLLKRLAAAPTWSLRWTLLTLSVISLAIAIWGVSAGGEGIAVGSVGASLLLMTLALAAQLVAERTGAVEKDRMQEEELRGEIAGWPRWKQITFLLVGLLLGLGILALRVWSDSSSPR